MEKNVFLDTIVSNGQPKMIQMVFLYFTCIKAYMGLSMSEYEKLCQTKANSAKRFAELSHKNFSKNENQKNI